MYPGSWKLKKIESSDFWGFSWFMKVEENQSGSFLWNFMYLGSWKLKCLIYLDFHVPEVPSFYLITQKSWLKTSKRKYKHFKSQKPVPWWPKMEPIKNLSPPVVVSGIKTLCWEFNYNPTTDSQGMAQYGIPLVAKKWTNQKNDPSVSREWQNYAYTVNFIEIGQQTPKLWPKRCPWWPKNKLSLNLMAPLKPPRKKKLILKILEFYLKKHQNESFSGAHIWESCSPLCWGRGQICLS